MWSFLHLSHLYHLGLALPQEVGPVCPEVVLHRIQRSELLWEEVGEWRIEEGGEGGEGGGSEERREGRGEVGEERVRRGGRGGGGGDQHLREVNLLVY